jgi:hypothetical protein
MIVNLLSLAGYRLASVSRAYPISISRSLGSNPVPPKGFGKHTDENADWLDAVASFRDWTATEIDSRESAVRGSVYTLRRINNDRCGFSRLSKIAHARINVMDFPNLKTGSGSTKLRCD